MITPAFELEQDDQYLYIIIQAPYSKVSETDVFVDGFDFKFYAKPYFLRLHLPGTLVEDERASTVYNADEGSYKVKIAKEFPGTHFEDLEMLTKLLATSGEKNITQPKIEVISSDSNEAQEDGDFDWQFPISVNQEPNNVTSLGDGYGFGNLKKDSFGQLQQDLQSVIQVKDLENSTFSGRLQAKKSFEGEQFDPGHYLADYFENEDITRIISIQPPYRANKAKDDFTEDEKFVLKNFLNREYLLDKTQLQSVYLGLVDILFSYAYNWRCTEGEYSVESAWDIRTISAVMSWCVQCDTLPNTIISSCRRALTFPFYRNWKLARTCKNDVAHILSKGRKYILKCLLEVHTLFAKSDRPYYILNDLYVKDYCIWIQKASDQSLASLAKSVKDFKCEKSDLDLELCELEHAAQMVLEEEDSAVGESTSEADVLAKQVDGLRL